MSKQRKHKDYALSDHDNWEKPHSLQQKEAIIQMQNQISSQLLQVLDTKSAMLKRLFMGFLEIADFMFKNTCGVGSNYQLAQCNLANIQIEDVLNYYHLILLFMAFHFKQLVPEKAGVVWEITMELAGSSPLDRQFIQDLEKCQELSTHQFSPVQAGRKLWENTKKLLHIKSESKSSAGKIYYQTAPGQNLIYMVEQGMTDGWLSNS
jgi:hypothetical protein